MVEVHEGRVWIGGASDFVSFESLFDAGVEAIVDLAIEERRPVVPRELVYCRFPINDGEGNKPTVLSLAIQTVASLIRAEVKTLVACSAGLARSPTVLAHALAILSNDSPQTSLAKIRQKLPVDIKPTLWREALAASDAMA